MEKEYDPDAARLIARAEEAHGLLTSPVFNDAMTSARDVFVAEWEEATTVADREAAHGKVAGLREVRAQLTRTIRQGEYALLTDKQ